MSSGNPIPLTKGEKNSSVGKPLVKSGLLSSVSGTDTRPNKQKKGKNSSLEEPLAKFQLLSSVSQTATRPKKEKKELSVGTSFKITFSPFS